MFDLILKSGLIYDGLGSQPQHNDIGITKEKIIQIGNLTNKPCHKIIDIKDLSVSPGFIDMHSHSDTYYFIHPQAECKIRQGVTTEVIGNCGGSGAPLYGEFRSAREKEWKGLGIKVKWRTFREYTDLLKEQGISLNVVPLTGHGNIRGAIKGYSTSPLTKKELKKMLDLLDTAMSEGAAGLSSGLIYTPGMYAGADELIALAKIAKKHNGIYTSHIRGEGDTLIKAVKEAILIAEKTGIKLQISHLKTSGKKNWGKLDEVFKTIEDAISRGQDVTCDRYPYIASNTDLDTLLPDWFHKMDYKSRKTCITKEQDGLAEILKNILDSGWYERVMIGRVKNKTNRWVEGLFVKDIAKKSGKGYEETIIELLRKADFDVQAMFFTMSEENLNEILKKHYVMIGSDSSLRALSGPLKMGHPHPRTFGTFPRVLARYTGNGLLTMEAAIHKMTGMPADKLKLKDRGRISPGAYADLVVFDQKKIKDRATYKKPFQYPDGIKYVIVNGSIVLDNGTMTKKLPGKVLNKKE